MKSPSCWPSHTLIRENIRICSGKTNGWCRFKPKYSVDRLETKPEPHIDFFCSSFPIFFPMYIALLHPNSIASLKPSVSSDSERRDCSSQRYGHQGRRWCNNNNCWSWGRPRRTKATPIGKPTEIRKPDQNPGTKGPSENLQNLGSPLQPPPNRLGPRVPNPLSGFHPRGKMPNLYEPSPNPNPNLPLRDFVLPPLPHRQFQGREGQSPVWAGHVSWAVGYGW